jgi:hypothetical protein
MLKDIRTALRAFASEADARVLRRFFKTGPGEYAEGDRYAIEKFPEGTRQRYLKRGPPPVFRCPRRHP